MLYSKNSTIEELDGFKPSISNEDTTESGAILDNFGSNKKASDEISSSKEMFIEGLKSRKPQIFISETLVCRVIVGDNESHQFKETKITPSCAGEPLMILKQLVSCILQFPRGQIMWSTRIPLHLYLNPRADLHLSVQSL